MALKPLNSVGGFSVGEVPANVILANADITANNATFSGNVLISNSTNTWGVLTDNLYYSNGVPWDFQQAAGSNGELQFNMGDDFAASPNLTFNNSTQLFTVTGNANITGTLSVGSLEVDEIFNGNSNVAIPVANGNVNISVAGNANVLVVTGTGANVAGYITATGAITGANLALTDGNITSTGTSGLYLTPANTTAGIVVQANTAPNANNSFNLGSTSKVFANIYGNNVIISANLDSGNANLGNLAVANYVNVNNDLNVTENVKTGNLQVNVSANLSNVQVANFVVSNLTPASDDQYYLGTTLKRWKDINIAGNANIATLNISGNGTFGNLEFGNLLTGNYATFDNDIQVLGNIANANNISVTNGIFTNNANITANLTSGNANLGNLAQANFVNVSQNLNVTGNIAGTYANLVGNLHIAPSGANNFGILTDHLYYANGTAWDLQEAAGSNNEIQYNSNDNFAASANFTYDDSTQVFKVTGNANITNTVITPNVNSLTGNLTLTANGFNTVLDNTGNATFPGNVTAHTFYGNVNANVTVSAANTSVLFSDAGAIAGATGFTFDKVSNTFSTPGDANVAGNLLVQGNANIANINITPNFITGDGTGIVLKDDTNGAQLEWNANAYVYVDNTGASLEANSFIATLDFAGDFSLPNNLSVVGNIANANNISVTNALDANTGNFSGNITSLNANLGNLVQGNFVNVASNVLTSNLTVNLELSGNTANFSGNVILPNLSVNSHLSGNTANFTGNVIVPNLQVNLHLAGNTANFTGNIVTANANLGNLAQANYVNVANNLTTLDANVTGTLTVANANISSNLTVNNLTVNLELSGNTANLIGNVVLSGAQVTVNNHIAGNTANFSGNITSLNANLGNIADANYVRTSEIYNGNSNVIITHNGNISLSATGAGNVVVVSNVGANVTGYVTANGNGTFGALYSNTLTAQGGNLTIYAAAGDNYVELRPTGNGHVNVGNFRIEALATPVNASDAATKQYVDDVAQGLNIHDSCYAATANTLAILTGGTITYNNGTAGVGANLVLSGSPTANYLSANVFDGNVTAIVGSRILVKSEANAAHNGVYVVDSSTVLTRASDYNTVPEVEAGDFVFVQDGTQYNDTGWVQTSVVVTIGTDPINFTQFSGAGTYQAGAGLTLTGTVFSVNVDNVTTEIAGSNVVVKANAQLTTPNIGAATGTSLDLTGNVLAGNVNANAKVTAANLEVTSNIIAGNISANANLLVNNATVNLSLSGNTANFSSNVVVNNFTTNLELAGNTANFSGAVIAQNVTANSTVFSANANVTGTTITNVLTVNNAIGGNTANFSGNVVVSNLTTNLELAGNTANFSGNVILPNLTVNTTLAGNVANFTGNLTAANGNLGNLLTANFANIASNTITNNLTVNLELAGNTANFSGNIVAGNISTSGSGGNITGANVVSANTFSGNIDGVYANLSANVVTATLVANTLANVANLNVTANVTSDLLPNANVTHDLGSTTQRWDNVYAANLNASGNLTVGNISANVFTANTLVANTSIDVGNTAIYWGEVTTTSITANQTISTVSISGITGIEWIVKGIDSTGAKYSMAIVTAVSDGANADYSQFGGVNLGSSTGTLAVNVVGSNVELQVTPSSSNSTVWVTQYRTI